MERVVAEDAKLDYKIKIRRFAKWRRNIIMKKWRRNIINQKLLNMTIDFKAR